MKITQHINKLDLPVHIRNFEGIIPVGYEHLEKMFPNMFEENLALNMRFPFKTRMGHTTRDELVFLAGLVKGLEPKTIFEIGTFDGLSTVNMAANAPEDCLIYTLDIPEEELQDSTYKIDSINSSMVKNPNRQGFFKDSDLSRKIIPLYGDSAKFNYLPYKGKMDIVFIDASHTFDYCYQDTFKALDLVKPGGVILWHDYNKVRLLPGVTESLNKVQRETDLQLYWMNDSRVVGGDTSIVFTIIKDK